MFFGEIGINDSEGHTYSIPLRYDINFAIFEYYRACDALRSCLPDMLRDATFSSCLREDPTTRRWLQQLVHNVQGPRVGLQGAGGFDHMLVN
ncbi:putative transcription regulator Rcd1-like family [Helianthus annuus]|nr:putative transcription regulator Rcd1-like family [Helianthus annuus]KAJ0723275.1 putative transcription regulator Rcd1-like family [Helianthus annuus]